jgi:hypothetical protein
LMPTFCSDCWMKVASSGTSSPFMDRHQFQGKARAAGAPLVAGLVEERGDFLDRRS